MKMPDLIRAAESKCRGLEREYEASRHRLRAMRERVDTDAPPSDTEVREATETHERISDRLDDARGDLESLRAQHLADLEVVRAQHDVTDTGVTRGGTMKQTGTTYVVAEPSTYTEHAERSGGPSFLKDLYAVQVKNDPQAGERLSRHGREVEATIDLSQRAGTTTSTVASFVPPQYVVDLFAEYARAGRPLCNLLTSLPLPPTGMSVTIPKITTPSQVGVQSTENSELSTDDVADTGIDVDVSTVGGYVPVSRQTLERGLLVEEMVFGDLASAYNAQLDTLAVTAALAQSSTNAITYTASSPTVVEIWPKLADAVGRVRSQRFSGPTAIVMHPTRFAWMQAALSTEDDRPLLTASASGPANAMAVSTSAGYDGSVGTLLNVPVILDANLPTNLGAGTNEDVIMVADWRDSIIMEEPNRAPVQLKFESVAPQNLTVHLVAYGYSAVTFARQPKSISKITGTGLVAPGAL